MHYFDASTRAEFAAQAEVLKQFDLVARRLSVDYLVVGALARDLLIRGVTGVPLSRATTDIDVAVAVPDWSAVNEIGAALTRVGDSQHTFVVDSTEIDIVPFAGVERPDRSIRWPNEHEMSVLGMSEALSSADTVNLGPVTVKVASLPAQVVLKLLAWNDRHLSETRDALDLRAIACSYGDEPYADRIGGDLLDDYDFDVELAGAHQLGFEAGRILRPADLTVVREILVQNGSPEGLLVAQFGPNLTRNRLILEALRAGLG